MIFRGDVCERVFSRALPGVKKTQVASEAATKQTEKKLLEVSLEGSVG
jgi:hypothetical protein